MIATSPTIHYRGALMCAKITSGHLCVSVVSGRRGEERRKSILTAFIKHAFMEKERKSLTKNFPSPLSEKDFHSIFVFIRIETRSVVEAFFGSAKRRKEKKAVKTKQEKLVRRLQSTPDDDNILKAFAKAVFTSVPFCRVSFGICCGELGGR